MQKLTTADRLDRAMKRAEEAAGDLLFQAERWSLQNRTLYDIRNDRVGLFREARRYANAMRRVAAVRPK